jgi:hypothetical protein
MPFTLKNILHHFVLVTNENTRCPHCRERQRIWKNGFYSRYRLGAAILEPIQRYRCRNAACPRQSFSILPHPFLPWLRVSLCFLATLWELCQTGRHTIAELARQANQGWGVMRRQVRRAAWLTAWLERERDLALAGLRPCADPRYDWTPLCQALSHARRPGSGGP